MKYDIRQEITELIVFIAMAPIVGAAMVSSSFLTGIFWLTDKLGLSKADVCK
jgi:hypothetical protein